uniref:Uncharacterized protein n=1 Tax=Globodera rostochiensis TaxID=31243 RepID=A0A914HWG3_GLORO
MAYFNLISKQKIYRIFGIELRLKKKEKEGFSLFSKGAGANGKLVQFSAEYVAQRVFVHILRAWESGAVE